jgi:hypothetical protein
MGEREKQDGIATGRETPFYTYHCQLLIQALIRGFWSGMIMAIKRQTDPSYASGELSRLG